MQQLATSKYIITFKLLNTVLPQGDILRLCKARMTDYCYVSELGNVPRVIVTWGHAYPWPQCKDGSWSCKLTPSPSVGIFFLHYVLRKSDSLFKMW